jgi:hypothetical protein
MLPFTNEIHNGIVFASDWHQALQLAFGFTSQSGGVYGDSGSFGVSHLIQSGEGQSTMDETE